MSSPSATELRALSASKLLSVFRDLQAPGLDEMNGDYDAKLLQQPSTIDEVAGWLSVGIPFMPWLSKGFRPVNSAEGRGYNSFRQFGKVVQRYPMKTLIAPSRYDDQPAYTLVYRAYHSFCGTINMVDEVRRVSDGVYLGIGTCGFSTGRRQVPLPFLLQDTGRPYIGDIGSARKAFEPGPRELPALLAPTRSPGADG